MILPQDPVRHSGAREARSSSMPVTTKENTMKFEELGIVSRHPNNPVLQSSQVPYDSSLVFNAGVAKFNGKYVMAFRNDYGYTQEQYRRSPGPFRTCIGLAESDDGYGWTVAPEPVFDLRGGGFRRAYDPRLTVIGGRCYMCFAADTDNGTLGGIAVTDDMRHFEVLSYTEPDNRNMVLFPEKIGGSFVRLDRPMPVYSSGGGEYFSTWVSESPDLRFWGNSRCILSHRDIPQFCNCKTGPAAPPVKTGKGWLSTFHAVWKLPENDLASWEPGGWNKMYMAGIMLLDLDDPGKVLGIADRPLMFPKTEYELEGFRGTTIFPGGMILEESGEVKFYYGASDTVECVATANVDELLKACLEHPARNSA